MLTVSLEDFKKHLKQYNTLVSVKYIDDTRYYFYKSKIVAKMTDKNVYHILKHK